MTTLSVVRPRAEVGRPFYLIMALLMAAVFLAGFSQTVPGDLAEPRFPLLLGVHGAVFTSWVILFIAQPSLVVAGDVRRHMQLGLVGAGLAAAMVIMGLAATVYSIGHHRVPSFFPKGVFLVMNGLGILVFGALVATAIAMRRQPEWHKRLMLCATASILGPGLGRFLPMDSFGGIAPLVLFGVNDLILLAGPVADQVVRRRIHPAYYWAVGAVVISQILIGPLDFAPPTLALLRAIQGG